MFQEKVSNDKLSSQDIEILEFERRNWGALPTKELEVLKNFGFSLVRYYQLLHKVCISRPAERYDPILTRKIIEKFFSQELGSGETI
tara:strand:+ start:559 stop:819 length:261 start_codon:yes stop_codon:yes gene_type:complete